MDAHRSSWSLSQKLAFHETQFENPSYRRKHMGIDLRFGLGSCHSQLAAAGIWTRRTKAVNVLCRTVVRTVITYEEIHTESTSLDVPSLFFLPFSIYSCSIWCPWDQETHLQDEGPVRSRVWLWTEWKSSAYMELSNLGNLQLVTLKLALIPK